MESHPVIHPNNPGPIQGFANALFPDGQATTNASAWG